MGFRIRGNQIMCCSCGSVRDLDSPVMFRLMEETMTFGRLHTFCPNVDRYDFPPTWWERVVIRVKGWFRV